MPCRVFVFHLAPRNLTWNISTTTERRKKRLLNRYVCFNKSTLDNKGKLLAHCNHCQPTTCSNIHACYNCETLLSGECLHQTTHTDAEACKAELSSSHHLSRASYVQATGACEVSNSECGIYYSESIDLLFYKTCNTGNGYTFCHLYLFW